jgi:hypothetical protein
VPEPERGGGAPKLTSECAESEQQRTKNECDVICEESKFQFPFCLKQVCTEEKRRKKLDRVLALVEERADLGKAAAL